MLTHKKNEQFDKWIIIVTVIQPSTSSTVSVTFFHITFPVPVFVIAISFTILIPLTSISIIAIFTNISTVLIDHFVNSVKLESNHFKMGLQVARKIEIMDVSLTLTRRFISKELFP